MEFEPTEKDPEKEQKSTENPLFFPSGYEPTDDEKTAVREFWSRYDHLLKGRGDVAKAEACISGSRSFLSKANADAATILGIKPGVRTYHNSGLTYAGMSFRELVENLDNFIDFSKRGRVVFNQKSSPPVDQKTSKAGATLERDYFFVAASFNPNDPETKYQGIFTLHKTQGQVRQVTLEYKSRSLESDMVKFLGTYEKFSGMMYLKFTEGAHQKMYIFDISATDYDRIKYLHGVYSGDSNNQPVAGEIFLERVASREEALQKLLKTVPDEARYLLHSKHIRVTQGGAFEEFDAMPKNKMFKDIQKRAGLYKGYYLSKQSAKCICECFLRINTDGSAIFIRHGAAEHHHGIAHFNDERLFLLFQYDTEIERFRYSLTLHPYDTISGGDVPRKLRGNYGSARGTYMPNAGRIIFQKIEETDELSPKGYSIKAEDAFDDVAHFLGLEKFNVEALDFLRGIKDPFDFSDDPYQLFKGTPYDLAEPRADKTKPQQVSVSSGDPTVPDDWTGKYEAFILQHFPTRDQECFIQRMEVIILKNGIEFRTRENAEYKGAFSPSPLQHKYLMTALCKQKSEPEIFLCLSHIPEELKSFPGAVFRGVYAGPGQDSNLPAGGRIVLYKQTEEFVPEDILLEFGNEKLKALLRTHKGLLDFFIGDKDRMIESYLFFRDTHFIPIADAQSRELCRRLAGVYHFIKMDSGKKQINVQPLRIQKNGQITLMSTYEDTYYHGVVNVFNNQYILSFNFHALTAKIDGASDFFAQALFYAPNKHAPVTQFKGLHLSKTIETDVIFCSRAFLYRVNEKSAEFKNHKKDLKKINIPLWGENVDQSIFNKENIRYGGLLSYLIGDEDNIILNPDYEKSLDYIRDVDYGLMYFLAAMFYWENGERDTAEKSLEKAFLNGFDDTKLFKQYLSDPKYSALLNKYKDYPGKNNQRTLF